MAVFIVYLCPELLWIVPQDSIGSALWVLCHTACWFWHFCRRVPILFPFLNDTISMNSIFLGVSKCFAGSVTCHGCVSDKCASQASATEKLQLLSPFDDTGYLMSQNVTRFFFLSSNTLDRSYPNIFVDFRLLMVPVNNKKITNITSFLIICTTHSLIRSVASSKPGPVIMNFNINNIFISEGWLMNIFLSHIFPCTLKKKLCVFNSCFVYMNTVRNSPLLVVNNITDLSGYTCYSKKDGTWCSDCTLRKMVLLQRSPQVTLLNMIQGFHSGQVSICGLVYYIF